MHRAERRAENDRCGGRWTPQGPLSHQRGPRVDRREAGTGRSEGWLFHSLRLPERVFCEQASRARCFLEMSRHLPGWISIGPADQLTACRRRERLSPSWEQLLAVR
jgi:hypothetical protein